MSNIFLVICSVFSNKYNTLVSVLCTRPIHCADYEQVPLSLWQKIVFLVFITHWKIPAFYMWLYSRFELLIIDDIYFMSAVSLHIKPSSYEPYNMNVLLKEIVVDWCNKIKLGAVLWTRSLDQFHCAEFLKTPFSDKRIPSGVCYTLKEIILHANVF